MSELLAPPDVCPSPHRDRGDTELICPSIHLQNIDGKHDGLPWARQEASVCQPDKHIPSALSASDVGAFGCPAPSLEGTGVRAEFLADRDV
jgi:hypothetical protein